MQVLNILCYRTQLCNMCGWDLPDMSGLIHTYQANPPAHVIYMYVSRRAVVSRGQGK